MSSPTSAENRQSIRRLRRALSVNEQRDHALELSNRIVRLNLFRRSKKIAFYLSNDGEIDPEFIIKQAWNMGKQVYLPVLAPLQDRLYFAPYHPDSKMRSNRFGINEPDYPPRAWIRAHQLNLMFLPLVAFDSKGNRLGMGGGFYDRSLAYLANRHISRKPPLIGLAHELQQLENIRSEKWDIPLDQIITEKRIIHI